MSQGSLGWAGPAQSDLLVHLCGRPTNTRQTPHVPPDIASASAAARLDRILTTGQMKGFPPFGAEADQPTACFSESPLPHLIHLLKRGWQPWGLLFTRQWVYDQGGEPVSYMRKARWDTRQRQDKPFAVRLEADPGEGWSDWTHEREWRVPLDPQRPYLTLTPQSVAGILIGDSSWQPTPGWGPFINRISGQLSDGNDPFDEPWPEPPPIWTSAPKWLWNSSTGQFLTSPQAPAPRAGIG